MTLARTRHIEAAEIPVIDMAPLLDGSPDGAARVGQAMRRAAETIGFFYVRNHAIPSAVIEAAHRASRAFFARPPEAKQRVAINAHHHGFLRVGEAKMYDDARVDLKESFVWGLELADDDPAVTPDNPFLGRNQWPTDPPGFRAALYGFFSAGLDCARELMRAFAAGMGLPGMDLPEETFIRSIDRPIARGSTIYYPPQPPNPDHEQFGVAPHTDFGVLTLLWQDDVGGLEVRNRAGEWVTAHPIPGTLVVNVGDLLARWTNNGFNSTPHRVVNHSGRERYSMVIAWDPDFETVIDPSVVCAPGETPKYPPISCGRYVLDRFDRAFAYRKRPAA